MSRSGLELASGSVFGQPLCYQADEEEAELGILKEQFPHFVGRHDE